MKLPYKYAVAFTVALGLFMAVLDNTIINVALTAMQETFTTDVNTIQWVITAYFLAQAAVIPVAGYFGNRIGIKRLFIIALAVFTAGSILCGLAPNLGGTAAGEELLIAFRVLQGIGGGMLFPLGVAIAFGAFPPAERAASSAFVAVPVLIAPTLGPTIGGLIIDSPLGWPWIFFVNGPIGLLAIALAARILQPDTFEELPAAGRPRFDYVGLLLSILGVTLVVYAFALVSQTRPDSITPVNPRGDIWGWGYWLVWALLGLGSALLVAFGLYETRVAKDPVLDLRLFRSYSFSVSTVLTWIVRAVVFGSFFLLPLFLQQVRGLSALETGLLLIPQGIAGAIGVASGSRLYDRIGPRALVTLGMIALTISSWMLVAVEVNSGWWFFLPILLVRGLGFGWSNLPLQTVALSAITGRALPKASSLYNATAQIFSSIGVAVLSTLFIQQTTGRSADLLNAARAAGGRPPEDLAARAGAGAVSDVFLILTIATALATLIGLLLPARSLKQQGTTDAATDGEAGAEPDATPARLAAE